MPPSPAAPSPASPDPAAPASDGSAAGPSANGGVEAPSGKNETTENFPVGSVLLSARVRPHVMRFYAFARAIDDIADSPTLTPAEKIARLDGFAEALAGTGAAAQDPAFAKARALRETVQETGVPARHGLDLIQAFRQDAVKTRYASWDELMAYCRLSAAPVGRFLIDLHGGPRGPAGTTAADALCHALQVINHLQDCQDDYRRLNRVYLPGDWLAEARARVEDLDQPRSSPALRRVIDRCLDGTRALMQEAVALPGAVVDWRLGMESAVIVAIAQALIRRLATDDPLAGPVKLGKPALALCALVGIGRGLGQGLAARRR